MGYLGLALCAGLCGVGSAIGLYFTGSAASGVLADDAKKFSKVLILVVLPATQGIYGFVFAIIGLGSVATLPAEQLLFASLPLALTGNLSGIDFGQRNLRRCEK